MAAHQVEAVKALLHKEVNHCDPEVLERTPAGIEGSCKCLAVRTHAVWHDRQRERLIGLSIHRPASYGFDDNGVHSQGQVQGMLLRVADGDEKDFRAVGLGGEGDGKRLLTAWLFQYEFVRQQWHTLEVGQDVDARKSLLLQGSEEIAHVSPKKDTGHLDAASLPAERKGRQEANLRWIAQLLSQLVKVEPGPQRQNQWGFSRQRFDLGPGKVSIVEVGIHDPLPAEVAHRYIGRAEALEHITIPGVHITSLQNPLIKSMLRLRRSAHHRRRAGLMLVEGWDEINLAFAAGNAPRTLIKDPERARRSLSIPGVEVATVGEKVFDQITQRESPDGWIGLFDTPRKTLASVALGRNPLLTVLESLEKPGNLGAILRTADATGLNGVIVCDPLADVYGPNVVRSSRGTVFSVPVIQSSSKDALEYLRQRHIRIVAATPDGPVDYTDLDLTGATAIVLGTESKGLSDAWLEAADVCAKIPMQGKVNSLNVSIAAAALIFEAVRQRKPAGGRSSS
jgi:TrmH family RNA methyltransferase